MRISDWSSDVCSSDLRCCRRAGCASTPACMASARPFVDNPRRKTMASSPDPLPKPKPDTIEPQSPPERPVQPTPLEDPAGQPTEIPDNPGGDDIDKHEIGRASCRERVCQYVWISGVSVSITTKIKLNNIYIIYI